MQNGPSRLVAVVDDDDAVRDSLQFLLEIAGFSVTTYGSAAQFLQRGADRGTRLPRGGPAHARPDRTATGVRPARPGCDLADRADHRLALDRSGPAGARARRGQGDGEAAGRRHAAGFHRRMPATDPTAPKRTYLLNNSASVESAAAMQQPDAPAAARPDRQRIGAAALDPRDRARRDDRDRRARHRPVLQLRRGTPVRLRGRARSADRTSGC